MDLSRYILTNDDAIVIDLKKSQGSWVVDNRGKQYLDCFSQYGSQPLGWNHPKLLANKEKLLDAALHKISNPEIYTEEYFSFVEKFASITPDFSRYFFISGGTLGVENALKAAFDWKTQKSNIKNLDIIHLREAFHGRSGYCLSLTNNNYDDTKVRYFPKFDWTRATNPKVYFPQDDFKVKKLEEISLNEVKWACKRGNVAAFILEPIQGEGGDNHFRKEYFQELRKLADKHEFLLIFDEVQTGMGMTGKMWCYEHFGVVPDIMSFGKKTQVCGCCATSRIDEIQENVFRKRGRISSTWGGSLVDMVRCSIFIETIQEDNLVENANQVGKYLLDRLTELPLKNVRGRGLYVAFDLENEQDRDNKFNLLRNKVLAIKCGIKSIRFRPHLTFSQEDADFLISEIKQIC